MPDFHSGQAAGSLMNYASSGGSVTLTNSTISGNTATSDTGGISQNAGVLRITNRTLSGNVSPSVGGFAHSGGTSTLQNTIIPNSAPQCRLCDLRRDHIERTQP